jgi:DNA-binding protein HU-beta
MERVEGLSRKDAAALIDGVFDDIQAAVVGSEPVKIPGFGQFKVRDRAARMARNPATGEQVKVPAKRVFKFLPAKALKEAVMSKRGAKASSGAKKSTAKKTAKKSAPARGTGRAVAKKAPARKAAAKKTTGRKTRR